MALSFNKNFNVSRVISRLITGVLALYVSGTILTEFGSAMTNTSSPLYSGLSLIGWTVGTTSNGTDPWIWTCSGGGTQTIQNGSAVTNDPTNCITATNGSGVLSVIGILVIAQVIMEFISF